MSTDAPISAPTDRRTFLLPFTVGQALQLMEDLPLGHSHPAASELYHRLREEVRKPLPQEGSMASTSEDITYASIQSVRETPAQQPVRGLVVRKQDVTGISGLGVIAEFCIFSDGKTAIRWLGGAPQNQPKIEVYDNPTMAPFIQISGHNGATELVWIDDPGPWA